MAGNQKPTDPPALASAGYGQLPFETVDGRREAAWICGMAA